MPVAPVAVAAAALGSAIAFKRVVAARRAGIAVTWHRMPWKIERRVRVVQLTDVHVGPTTPRRHLARIAEVVQTLECDLVVLTGDYVNTSLYFADRITALVEALPKPCIATLGNHDHWTDPERVTRALTNGGARVLRNESTVVEGSGWSLPVVGVDDGRSGNADVARSFARVDRDAVDRALVLSHFPSLAESIATKGAPLVLSGHTHGGQLDARGVTKWVAKLSGNPYLHGFYRIAKTDLYVSAGIGHSLHGLRDVRTAPEIAVFELCPETRERRSCTLRTAW